MPECIHLISQASCGTCNPPAGQPPPAPERWGPWFTAAYPGDCAGCGDGLFPGDLIRADGDGGYLCQDCGREEFA